MVKYSLAPPTLNLTSRRGEIESGKGGATYLLTSKLMIDEPERVVYFYGKLAGGTRRDAIRLARSAGWRAAETLSSAVNLVVLGEGADLAQTRRSLAEEFDERSDLAFERGTLQIVSESEFVASVGAVDDGAPLPRRDGATPAAVAEVVGASVEAVRRWLRRGLLAPIDPNSRFPLLSPREIQVARRLAFLCSGALSEELVERQIRAFAHVSSPDQNREIASRKADDAELFPLLAGQETDENESSDAEGAPVDLGAVILSLTLSTDGREILKYRDEGRGADEPIDSRGQRFFGFAARPPDGTIDKPEDSVKLSPEEEQFALAERLSDWNARTTAQTGVPAFLELFSDDRETPTAEPETPSAPSSTASDARTAASWRDVASARQARLCAQAWLYEREGYWEEAARAYRLAALAGGADPGIDLCLGRTLCLLGDYSAARERFSSALELDPNLNDARVELGRAYVSLHDYDEALSVFREARDARPDDPAPRVELGKLMLRVGDRDAAKGEFRRAAERIDDPRFAADVAALIASLESSSR